MDQSVTKWSLRYAPHLGYIPPPEPQFVCSAGNFPPDHVSFAARHGMLVCYIHGPPLPLSRNAERLLLLRTYIEAYDDICLLQLADMPGRIEPGSGEIDFVPLLAEAIFRKYDGLVDLEHGWSIPGVIGENRGLEQLAEIDSAARRTAEVKRASS